jgi:hypothetical protein
LLALREPGWMRGKAIRNTWFMSAENNRALYFSAVTQMPGAGFEVHKGLKTNSNKGRDRTPSFAECRFKSEYGEFFFCNVDDMMEFATSKRWQFDAVWLDYTGPMTIRRLYIIARFYRTCIQQILVVTALKARWNRAVGEEIDRHGGFQKWLRRFLPGQQLHFLEYRDGFSPMLQYAVRKRWKPKFYPELLVWGDDGGANLD